MVQADDTGLISIDVIKSVEVVAAPDPGPIHIKAFDLPRQPEQVAMTTSGIVQLGESLAMGYF